MPNVSPVPLGWVARTWLLAGAAFILTCAGCGVDGSNVGQQASQKAALTGRYEILSIDAVSDLGSASDVNAHGLVVATGRASVGGTEPTHSFLWQDGRAEDLGPVWAQVVNDQGDLAGSDGSVACLWRADGNTVSITVGSAHGINNAGYVVGEARAADGTVRAFLWNSGQLLALGTLGGGNSVAYGVNDAGTAVGWAENGEGRIRACLWKQGGATDLGTLGGDHSMAYAINALGQIVGYAETGGGVDHAFITQEGGRMVDLGGLGGYSVAYDVDRLGRVVGESATPSGTPHAFLWEGGEMIDLNLLLPAASGWELLRAFALSDSGDVVGQGIYRGSQRAFRLVLAGPRSSQP